jgi:methyl-accepting chemotaxis protein
MEQLNNEKFIVPTNEKFIVPTNEKFIVPTNEKFIIPTNEKFIVPTNEKFIIPTNDLVEFFDDVDMLQDYILEAIKVHDECVDIRVGKSYLTKVLCSFLTYVPDKYCNLGENSEEFLNNAIKIKTILSQMKKYVRDIIDSDCTYDKDEVGNIFNTVSSYIKEISQCNKNETKSVANETTSVANETKSVANETKSVANETKSVANETKSVANETKLHYIPCDLINDNQSDLDSVKLAEIKLSLDKIQLGIDKVTVNIQQIINDIYVLLLFIVIIIAMI